MRRNPKKLSRMVWCQHLESPRITYNHYIYNTTQTLTVELPFSRLTSGRKKRKAAAAPLDNGCARRFRQYNERILPCSFVICWGTDQTRSICRIHPCYLSFHLQAVTHHPRWRQLLGVPPIWGSDTNTRHVVLTSWARQKCTQNYCTADMVSVPKYCSWRWEF